MAPATAPSRNTKVGKKGDIFFWVETKRKNHLIESREIKGYSFICGPQPAMQTGFYCLINERKGSHVGRGNFFKQNSFGENFCDLNYFFHFLSHLKKNKIRVSRGKKPFPGKTKNLEFWRAKNVGKNRGGRPPAEALIEL
jgi:hypothetical protein